MENTRHILLGILRKHKQATVEELTRELGLAPATVRRHLDILMRDNCVTAVAKRRDIGRPHYVFSLTDQGEDLFPRSYVQLANRIIEELVSLSPEETRGKGGVALADTLFEKMAEHVAQTYAGRISGKTLKERISEVVALLANEGMFFELRKAKGGYLLVGQGCPCPRIANAHSEVCVHDQRLLARLLDAEVQPAGVSEDDVRSCCAYTVKERASAGS